VFYPYGKYRPMHFQVKNIGIFVKNILLDEHRLFLWISRSEGISFLLLLGVAMPLKYIWLWPLGVEVIGMAHGLLFIAYEVLAWSLRTVKGWTLKQWMIIALCALLPFGPFYVEKKYLS
jgi:integral membrane protein